MSFTRKELINKLDDFLETKELKKRSAKDYRVDCMSFINFYLNHRHIKDGQMYNVFIKALNNSKLSDTTKRRRILVVGEFLFFLDMYSSTNIINCLRKNNRKNRKNQNLKQRLVRFQISGHIFLF